MLSLTTSEMEVNYYTQKLNAQIVLRVAKGLKVKDLRKLRDFRKNLEISCRHSPNTHSPLQTCKSGNNARKLEKSSNEFYIESPILLNFINLRKIFSGRFSQKAEYTF